MPACLVALLLVSPRLRRLLHPLGLVSLCGRPCLSVLMRPSISLAARGVVVALMAVLPVARPWTALVPRWSGLPVLLGALLVAVLSLVSLVLMAPLLARAPL